MSECYICGSTLHSVQRHERASLKPHVCKACAKIHDCHPTGPYPPAPDARPTPAYPTYDADVCYRCSQPIGAAYELHNGNRYCIGCSEDRDPDA